MKRLLFWGTGGQAEMILKNFPHETHEIVAFVDNNPARRGQFHGRPVVGPAEALGLDYDRLVIASAFYAEIRQQALDLGIAAEKIHPALYLAFLCQSRRAHLSDGQLDKLCRVPWWFHSFEILPGVMTPGVCPYKPELLDLPELRDLTGKRVLDIGAWDGPYTLEMARRGAKVTGFDIQPPSHSGFNTMRELNNLDAGHLCANVYDLSPAAHGSYDLVTFFGVYYHLKNPLAAFANINAVLPVGGLMLVEGAVLEGAPLVDPFWAKNADKIELMRDIPVGYYVKETYQGEWSNWWVPNMTCLNQWIESCGFEVEQSSRIEGGARGFCVARKLHGIPEEHIVLPPPC